MTECYKPVSEQNYILTIPKKRNSVFFCDEIRPKSKNGPNCCCGSYEKFLRVSQFKKKEFDAYQHQNGSLVDETSVEIDRKQRVHRLNVCLGHPNSAL